MRCGYVYVWYVCGDFELEFEFEFKLILWSEWPFRSVGAVFLIHDDDYTIKDESESSWPTVCTDFSRELASTSKHV
jgi:hypothetical protein